MKGPGKSEEWSAGATHDRHRVAETRFDRKLRRQCGRNPQPASHSIFLAARSSNPASNEHQAPAFSCAAPKLCSRARTHTRRPVPAEKIDARHQLECIGTFPAAGTTEASAPAVPQGCQLGRVESSRKILQATTARGRHRSPRAAHCYVREITCAACPGTVHYMRHAPAP